MYSMVIWSKCIWTESIIKIVPTCFINVLVIEYYYFNNRVNYYNELNNHLSMWFLDRNTFKLIQYRRLLKTDGNNKEKRRLVFCENHRRSFISFFVLCSTTGILPEIYKCLLTLINNCCFLLNCIHWLPIPGFLWSGKLSVFIVGLCGTVATLCNILKMVI